VGQKLPSDQWRSLRRPPDRHGGRVDFGSCQNQKRNELARVILEIKIISLLPVGTGTLERSE
jgi:hypothetical protein